MAINTLKSLAVLLGGVVLLALVSTWHALAGLLAIWDFPLLSTLEGNFRLLLPLSVAASFLSPAMGLVATRIDQNRFQMLAITAALGYVLAVPLSLLAWSPFEVELSAFAGLTLWVLVVFSFVFLPVLGMAAFLIERWTRKRPQIG